MRWVQGSRKTPGRAEVSSGTVRLVMMSLNINSSPLPTFSSLQMNFVRNLLSQVFGQPVTSEQMAAASELVEKAIKENKVVVVCAFCSYQHYRFKQCEEWRERCG